MKTRSSTKANATRKRVYRKRVKTSKCRGKGPAACRGTRGCKYSSKGKKRTFCRKSKNVKLRLA